MQLIGVHIKQHFFMQKLYLIPLKKLHNQQVLVIVLPANTLSHRTILLSSAQNVVSVCLNISFCSFWLYQQGIFK